MINWDKHFDKIICLSLVNNTERRKDAINDFNRVGIMDGGIFEWKITVDNTFYHYIWNNPHFKGEHWFINPQYKGTLNCTMGHYEIYKQCQVLGYKKVLILEDDCRFLKDIDEISYIINKTPNNYDICLFDKFIPIDKSRYFQARDNCRINEQYFDFSTCKLWSCGCYAVSDRAINEIIKSQETCYQPSDQVINKVDNNGNIVSDDNLVRISSIKNLAVQEFHGKTYKTDYDKYLDQQIYVGIAKRNEYNVKL